MAAEFAEYFGGADSPFSFARHTDRHAKLVALGPDPTEADIQRVVGSLWFDAIPPCDGCGKEVETAVEVGDRQESVCTLCRECLVNALTLFPNQES